MSCCDEGEINFVHRDGSDRSCPPKNHNEVIQLVLFEERKKCTNTVHVHMHVYVCTYMCTQKNIYMCTCNTYIITSSSFHFLVDAPVQNLNSKLRSPKSLLLSLDLSFHAHVVVLPMRKLLLVRLNALKIVPTSALASQSNFLAAGLVGECLVLLELSL